MQNLNANRLRWAARGMGVLQIIILLICAIWLASGIDRLKPGGFAESIPPFRLTPSEPNQYTFGFALLFFSIPSIMMIILFLGALKWEWVGGIGFTSMGIAHLIYILLIDRLPPIFFLGMGFPGPILISGLLFLSVLRLQTHPQERQSTYA